MKSMLKILAFVGIIVGVLAAIKLSLEISESCSKKYYVVENSDSAF